MEKDIPVTEARAQFAELVNRVGYGKERIILTRHGKPLVALVPAEFLSPPTEDRPGELTVLDLSAQPASDQRSLGLAAEERANPST